MMEFAAGGNPDIGDFMNCSSARVWAEIDPGAVRRNAEFAIRHTGAGLIAVLKANAYGHGIELVGPALRETAELFAVANLEEAATLQACVPEKDVLLLSPCLPAERQDAASLGCIATVSNAAEARAFVPAGGGSVASVQLKVDTGMGRVGTWHTEALEEIETIRRTPGVRLHSIATHLPAADEDETFTRAQLEAFSEFAATVRTIAPEVRIHALNSAGVCAFPEYAFDLVRAGLLLYGSTSVAGFQQHLSPALAWKSRVTLVRDVPGGRSVSYGRTYTTPATMRIATVAAGYADGYPRHVSGHGAQVLVGGRRCAVLGRVTMDQFLVNVSAVPNTKPGDEVVLIGSQGNETILASELARWADTIAWDIFTGIRGRTKRLCIPAPEDALAGV